MVVNDDIDIMRMLKSKDRNIFRFLEIFLGSEMHVNTESNFVTEHTTSSIQAKQVQTKAECDEDYDSAHWSSARQSALVQWNV